VVEVDDDVTGGGRCRGGGYDGGAKSGPVDELDASGAGSKLASGASCVIAGLREVERATLCVTLPKLRNFVSNSLIC
jgi:hypothetical protein